MLRDPVFYKNKPQKTSDALIIWINEREEFEAIDESETKSPIKITSQERNDEVVYLSRTRKKAKRFILVVEKINELRIKLCRKVMMRTSKNEGGF